MAFSFRTGINWYHDFPKLARDSGFYFNMHKNKTRIDWNRIAGIDIERVIQDKNFFIIDENINSIIDYNLDSEYDVKILDPNFVKLFRLAQLSVEYLLYCKQYLDHSVVIIKDELRSKIEENVKLKKELALADEDLSLLKDTLKHKYKIFEKMYSEKTYSETPKDVHKCPYCQKIFASAVFIRKHIGRRHSNSSQLSSTSPVHEQSKIEKEKLQDEVKNLKEKLNQTERVINNESDKSPRNIKLNGKNYENKTDDIQSNEVNKDKVLEEEHKNYQEEINSIRTFFNEIKSLREDEKKSNQLDNENENLKELLKQQENEIHRLTDQIRDLSAKQSVPNLEMIHLKLTNQEEYWKSKIDQIESQHNKDIEELSMQLRLTQEIAEKMRNDYINNIQKLEEKSKNCDESVQSVTKSLIVSGQQEVDELREKNSANDGKEKNRKFFDKKYNTIDDKGNFSTDSTETGEKVDNDLSNLQNQSYQKSDCPESQKKYPLDETKLKSQSIYTKVVTNEKKIGNALSRQYNKKIKDSIRKKMNTKIDVSSSPSDTSESESEDLSNSEDSEESQSTENRNCSSQALTESVQDEFVQRENFKHEVLTGLEQKLLDLGVDIEMDGIPKSTFQRLITIVKHHRNIGNKKYQRSEEIRRSIIHQINKTIYSQQQTKKKLQVYDTPKKSQLKSNMSYDASKDNSSSEVKARSNIPKIKFELLPMKMTHQNFQDLNTTRLNSKEDEINKKRSSSNNRIKSSSSQVVYVDSMQQEKLNSKKITSVSKSENNDKPIGNDKHKVIFSPKLFNHNDHNKDEIDIVSINDDDENDGNEAASNHNPVKTYEELNKFPQPAPRVTRGNFLEALQSVKKDLITNKTM